MFGRATITLGTGPHSSLFLVSSLLCFKFGSVWQIKLAIRKLLGARKYSASYGITLGHFG